MRQLLQAGLTRTARHILHVREFFHACKYVVATEPQRTIISKHTYGSLQTTYTAPLGKNLQTCLLSKHIIDFKRGMSKLSQPDASMELSLENRKVQEYLKRLREEHEAALRSEMRPQEARGQTHLMTLLDQVEHIQSDMRELSTLAEGTEGDKEMQLLAREDLQEARQTLLDLQEEIFTALVPEEVIDGKDVVVEVSAGVGGQEAMLFCQEVFNMYQSYARHRGWRDKITDYETTDIGGLRHGSIVLSGDHVYGSLKYEGGTHRVQRVPKTEKAGRVHTSTVSVAVLPQPSEIDIQISEKDLKVETKKASGPGGQHVNATDSAVRITYLPTGLAVESQKERSQHMNKEMCLRKLQAILYQQQLDQNIQQYNSNRKLQVGAKGRSEKIRTYNFPQDRVTDHRLGVSIHNLLAFMDGTEMFHALICQLVEEGQKEALQELIYGMKT